ncbi:MAG: HesA/MoeB/ThiF family protein [Myxococcales bacterium]|nr:HesA/MoeB/ThiF family protein [Myxococcales bacterium]
MKRCLVIGAGGIGAPFCFAVARAGQPLSLLVADDDEVERSNLHRQILFGAADVGRPKLVALRDAALSLAPDLDVELVHTRLLPDNAVSLVSRADVVVDATDNFASRFLIADACRLAGRPCVHAAAVRWTATVIAASPVGRPCYRCLFEDLPEGPAPDCATAGVVGPVCGVAGAIAADFALRILRGDESAYGAILTYDGKGDRLRRVEVKARPGCELCGETPSIFSIDVARYAGAACLNDP